jgi:hypothetical protein
MGVFTLFLTGGSGEWGWPPASAFFLSFSNLALPIWIIATFSVLSIVAAVITGGSPVAIAAGAVALFLAPVAMVQRFRLSKMASKYLGFGWKSRILGLLS